MTDKKFTLMAVHAHPDDESIGTGGVLARYAAEGVRTIVVCGTRGETGDILNPEFVSPTPGLRIADIRMLELEKALKALQVESVYFLGYRDSGMAGTPENMDPRAFAQADVLEATTRLVEIIRKVQPHVIVTYNEQGFYGHPDHIMASRVTSGAFHATGDPEFACRKGLRRWQPAKLYYTATPVARLRKMHHLMQESGEAPRFDPEVLGTPEEKITATIDVREFLSAKLEALYCHQSQISPNSFFRRVPKEWRDEAFGYEHFTCVHGCAPSDRKETDLFENLNGEIPE